VNDIPVAAGPVRAAARASGAGQVSGRRTRVAVVGVGHADKAQVLHMVARLLPGVAPQGADATDALAIAICHAWSAGSVARRAAALERGR